MIDGQSEIFFGLLCSSVLLYDSQIESLIQSHARRAESIEAELTLLESMLAGAKQQQINHLENLKRLGKLHKYCSSYLMI